MSKVSTHLNYLSLQSRNACALPVALTVFRSVRGSGVIHVTDFSSLRRSSKFLTGLVDRVRLLSEPEVKDVGAGNKGYRTLRGRGVTCRCDLCATVPMSEISGWVLAAWLLGAFPPWTAPQVGLISWYLADGVWVDVGEGPPSFRCEGDVKGIGSTAGARCWNQRVF